MQFADLVPHLVEAVGKIFPQPVFKNVADGTVQPHHRHASGQRAMVGSGFQHLRNFVVVEAGYDGCVHHTYCHPALCQFFHHLQPFDGAGGARFHLPAQRFVQRGNGNHNMNQFVIRQLLQQIHIAQYQTVFGNDAHGVAVLEQQSQHFTGQFKFFFLWLVTVGITRKHYG